MALAKSRWTADARGFSLIEVLVATLILMFGVLSVAQLFTLAIRSNMSSKYTSFTSVLAEQKMEQLRSLTYGFDSLGLPLTDTTTNTAVSPQQPTGGAGLSPSPADALKKNSVGYCDFLDRAGNLLDANGATVAPNNTVYVRRWSIQPLPTNPNNTIVIQVLVTARKNRGTADTTTNPAGIRLPDETRIISVKTRKAT
jgi:type IV pilus modification protein PilV